MIVEFFADVISGILRLVAVDFLRERHTPLVERIRRRRWRDTPEEKRKLSGEEATSTD
jgi:hypothetical protein